METGEWPSSFPYGNHSELGIRYSQLSLRGSALKAAALDARYLFLDAGLFHCAAGTTGTDLRLLAAHDGRAAYPRVSTASAPAVIPCSAPPEHCLEEAAMQLRIANLEFRMHTVR